MGQDTPMIIFLAEEEVFLALAKVHEGIRGSEIHIRTLESKILRVGYQLTRILKDNIGFVNRCEKYQRFSNFIQVPHRDTGFSYFRFVLSINEG